MDQPAYSDEHLKQVLRSSKSIVIVGISPKPERPSWQVGQFLHDQGYKVIPVNPGLDGRPLFGQTSYASLADVARGEGQVDMVDVFRRADAVTPIVQEALEQLSDLGLKTIWMQLGVVNHEAAKLATDAGLSVIMDRCPKIEHRRLLTT